MTNTEIGEIAGGMSCSGVSRVEDRFVEKLKKDKGLSKDLMAVLNKLSNINGLTPYPLIPTSGSFRHLAFSRPCGGSLRRLHIIALQDLHSRPHVRRRKPGRGHPALDHSHGNRCIFLRGRLAMGLLLKGKPFTLYQS